MTSLMSLMPSTGCKIESRAVKVIVLLTLLACAVGCGDDRLPTYPVLGKVVFADGSPVKLGTIECLSETHGVQATGSINRDGTFTLKTYRDNDGAVEGTHKCVIVQFVQVEGLANYKPSTLGVDQDRTRPIKKSKHRAGGGRSRR
jgi:hypothetical protein